MKVYDGAVFVDAVPKVYDGAVWVPAFGKVFNGTEFVPDQAPPSTGFEDLFNRPDSDNWGSDWDFTDGEGAGKGDESIVSDRGFMTVFGSSVQDDFAAQVLNAKLFTPPLEMLWLLQSDTTSNDNGWVYMMWLSTADFTGSAGRPSDAWYLRRNIRSGSNEYIFYRRIGGSETQIENLGTIGSALSNQWVRVIMDAVNHIQIFIWTDGSSEPSTPQLDYTESGATPQGDHIQINVRKFNNNNLAFSFFIDNINVDDI